MASEIAAVRTAPSFRSLPLARWGGLGALLFCEVMFLTIRFDTVALYNLKGWWVDLLGQSWIIPQVCVAVTAALLLFSGQRLRQEMIHVASTAWNTPNIWSYLGAHLTVFLSFCAVTGILLGGNIESSSHPGLWALAWVSLAAATGLTWLAMVIAPRVWLPLLRHAWLPLVIGLSLGIAAWGAGRVTKELWRPLSNTTLWLVHILLNQVTTDVVHDASICALGTSRFWVKVDPACSGYEGIGLIWVFLGGYLWFFRSGLRFPQAFLLFPLGTFVIYLANALRIFSLILLGTYGSADIALGGFHSQAGWLALNLVALGLVGVAGRSRFFSLGATKVRSTNFTAAYLAPMLAVVLATMLSLIFTHGTFDYGYPVRVIAAAATLAWFWRVYPALSWRCSWEAIAAGFGVFALWMALEPASDPAVNDRFASALGDMGKSGALVWLLFRIFGSVVTVPIAEELAFRGYLSRRLIAADFQDVPLGKFTWFSFLLSSVAFGMLHGRWYAGTMAGFAYAYVLYRTKRLSDPMWAHAITNALIAAYVLATSTWTLW
jgi:exosortase E/protease (VPEID-CTERM system)